jgi:hypothetical protein
MPFGRAMAARAGQRGVLVVTEWARLPVRRIRSGLSRAVSGRQHDHDEAGGDDEAALKCG